MIFFISLVLFSSQSHASKLPEILKAYGSQGTRVSAEIVNLETGKELLKVNEGTPLNPASSIKLFTAYTALKRLGVNYSYKTSVYSARDQGLCVKGSGDPSFVMEHLWLLVQDLKRKGLQSFSGKLTLDATAFDDELYPEERTDQDSERAYNAPLSGLNFNYNTITVFVNPGLENKGPKISLDFPFDFVKIESKVQLGSSTNITWNKEGRGDQEVVSLGGKIEKNGDEWHKPFRIRKPTRAFAEAFYRILEESGVKPRAKLEIGQGACAGDPIATHSSDSLSNIVQLMDKYSNNFIADSLIKTMDHEVSSHPGTTDGGLKFVRTELEKLGIPSESKGRSFVSGSGLTRENKMAAHDFILLLKNVVKEKQILPELFTSLPIAGVDGTLKKKYGSTAIAEKLRAKTGTLNGVQSLVGVIPTKGGDWLGVAIVTNGSRGIPETELAHFLSDAIKK